MTGPTRPYAFYMVVIPQMVNVAAAAAAPTPATAAAATAARFVTDNIRTHCMACRSSTSAAPSRFKLCRRNAWWTFACYTKVRRGMTGAGWGVQADGG